MDQFVPFSLEARRQQLPCANDVHDNTDSGLHERLYQTAATISVAAAWAPKCCTSKRELEAISAA